MIKSNETNERCYLSLSARNTRFGCVINRSDQCQIGKRITEMQDVMSMLNALRRPQLLIRAARFGAQEYRRDKHLQRLLGYGALPRPAAAVLCLMEIERTLNEQRNNDDAGYVLSRHVDVLIAMMGEAQLLRSARSDILT
jgi:hypothetical protein